MTGTPRPTSAAARSATSAEISSLASSLSEISRRVSALTSDLRAGGDEDGAADILPVEKALEAALRRFDRVLRNWSA